MFSISPTDLQRSSRGAGQEVNMDIPDHKVATNKLFLVPAHYFVVGGCLFGFVVGFVLCSLLFFFLQ